MAQARTSSSKKSAKLIDGITAPAGSGAADSDPVKPGGRHSLLGADSGAPEDGADAAQDSLPEESDHQPPSKRKVIAPINLDIKPEEPEEPGESAAAPAPNPAAKAGAAGGLERESDAPAAEAEAPAAGSGTAAAAQDKAEQEAAGAAGGGEEAEDQPAASAAKTDTAPAETGGPADGAAAKDGAPDLPAQKTAEETDQFAAENAKRQHELQAYIDSRKFAVPINASAQSRSIKISILLTVIVFLLALVLVDLMLDSGLVLLIQKIPHTHFFGIYGG